MEGINLGPSGLKQHSWVYRCQELLPAAITSREEASNCLLQQPGKGGMLQEGFVFNIGL